MFNNGNPKIGYLLKTYPKVSETFILNEILELENQGLDLHIFSLRNPSDEKFHPDVAKVKAQVTYIPSILPKLTSEDFASLLQAQVELIAQDKERYWQMMNFYDNRPEEKRLNEFLQAGYLILELQRLKIAHLHAHFANIPTAVAEIVQQFSGISYSITAHAKDIYLSKSEVLNRRITKADFVLTCTQYNQKFLQAISQSTPIHLSYHGLDLTRFQPVVVEAQNQEPLILSVGRFCEKKGFPYLLQACQILKQKGYKFRCCIVGYGPLQGEIERIIEELQLDDIVSLAGKMTQDELVKLYRQADMFVLPCLITEDGDRDGIPNVLLEAMAMNVPVISTNISGITELINHQTNGLLVPSKDSHALAKEIAELIERPQLIQQLKEAGRATILRQFSLDKNIKQVKNLLLTSARKSSSNHQLQKVEVAV